MTKLEAIYEKFLNDSHRLSKTKAGITEASVPSENIRDRLVNNLLRQDSLNKWLIIIIMIMFVVIFGVGIYLALYYRDQPKTMGVIFGGSFFSLLVIIRGLQNLWKQKTTMDMLLTLVPNMTPDKAVEIIEILYYQKKVKTEASITP